MWPYAPSHQRKNPLKREGFFFGGRGWSRTTDLVIISDAL